MKRILLCVVLVCAVWLGRVSADHQNLKNTLIRFHVVANSDNGSDQQMKLLVRDAVIESIQEDLAAVSDVREAKQYIAENLPKIEAIANKVLETAGFEDRAVATLCRERFSTRQYDTFSLPAGVYEALRIVIGQGNGHNWWCVSFPSLCLPTTVEAFEVTAVDAGISEVMANTLAGEEKYELRFFLMDVLGRVENYFFEK